MTLENTALDEQHADIKTAADGLGIRIDQQGVGRAVLVLHGGGGPASVAAFADSLSRHCHVIVPIHPGFAGTSRPPEIASVKDLARSYAVLIERSGLQDVLVIGFSMGGWIAAELAASNANGIGGLILVDAVGIQVPGQDVLDIFSIAPGDIASYSYHTPDRYRIDMASLTEQQAAATRANFAALAVYDGKRNMQDPELRGRLADVRIPALVVWGESDRVVSPEYGRSYAAALPNSRFELIPECGHLPQIEQPQRLMALVQDFGRDGLARR